MSNWSACIQICKHHYETAAHVREMGTERERERGRKNRGWKRKREKVLKREIEKLPLGVIRIEIPVCFSTSQSLIFCMHCKWWLSSPLVSLLFSSFLPVSLSPPFSLFYLGHQFSPYPGKSCAIKASFKVQGPKSRKNSLSFLPGMFVVL